MHPLLTSSSSSQVLRGTFAAEILEGDDDDDDDDADDGKEGDSDAKMMMVMVL